MFLAAAMEVAAATGQEKESKLPIEIQSMRDEQAIVDYSWTNRVPSSDELHEASLIRSRNLENPEALRKCARRFSEGAFHVTRPEKRVIISWRQASTSVSCLTIAKHGRRARIWSMALPANMTVGKQ